jgi:O-Antigen ligase
MSIATARWWRWSGQASPLHRIGAGQLTAVGTCFLILIVGRANGGYFPTTWGWIVLALGWAACLGLLLREHVALNAFEIASLTGLALFVTWVAASVGWSQDRSQTVFEIERDLVYAVAVLAALVIVRKCMLADLLGGLLAGIAAVDVYALVTRLFPGNGSGSDAIFLDQLARPIGYSNGLGIFSVVGVFLALGFASSGNAVWARSAAGGALPVLLTTLYFTYSRGAWLALFAGFAAMVALDPRRLRLLAFSVGVAPWSVLAVWVSSREHALTSLIGSHGTIRHEGRHLGAIILALVVLSGTTAVLLARIERNVVVGRATRRAFAVILLSLALAALASVFVRYGDPVDLARHGYASLKASPSTAPSRTRFHNNLNERLFTLNGTFRVQQWHAAWHDYEAHPWLGSGAGSFERYWLAHRTVDFKVRDAHNLYIEVLAELGWVGLFLLAIAFGAPLVAAFRTRRNRLVTTTFAAYVAYLLHTGIDWDWELPAVTLAGLLCGIVLLVGSRDERHPARRTVGVGARAALAAAVILIAAFSVLGLLGNRALASATRAVDRASWKTAELHAHDAIRWMPWSGQAWQQLGDAQLGLGDRRAALASLMKGVDRSPGDWSIWFDLGTASRGSQRRQAYRRAAALNPLNVNVAFLSTR